MLKKIGLEKLNEFVSALIEKGTLFAPVKGDAGVDFQEIKNAGDVTLDFYNTLQSPKCVFFPQIDDMVRYRLKKETTDIEEISLDFEPRIAFGIRPCDVKSFEIMDKLFTGGGIVDPYWENRRKNTTIMGYAFDTVDPADFYGAFGLHAADTTGSDVFMVKGEKNLLLKAITEKGEKLLGSVDILEDALEEDRKYFEERLKEGAELETRTLSLEGVAGKLRDMFGSPYWEKVAAPCLNCGVCTFVCPTCHCFDIQDETLFGEGTRRKIWDSCMFTDFTLEASGHNPRTQKSQRLRQRVNHKFSYYVTNFEVTSCVGCGRCTRSCPVNIDILTVVEEAVEMG